MPGTNYMKKVKERMTFSESMRPSALRSNKFIGELKKAQENNQDSFVVNGKTYETKGSSLARLNKNMELETITPKNAAAMSAMPGQGMPNPNNVLQRASKMSKAKFPLMPTKYMNPPKMGTIFSKANKSKKK
jgi:hypothetical protein